MEEDSEEVKMPRESSEHFPRRYWNWETGMLGFWHSIRCGCEAAVGSCAVCVWVKQLVARYRGVSRHATQVFACIL